MAPKGLRVKAPPSVLCARCRSEFRLNTNCQCAKCRYLCCDRCHCADPADPAGPWICPHCLCEAMAAAKRREQEPPVDPDGDDADKENKRPRTA